jgi:hypothetical protein
VTTTLRQADCPAALCASTITVLEPASSGIVALHRVVPLAEPECPVLVDQVTEVTPALAIPAKTIEEAAVEIEVADGVVMASEGGAVLPGALGGAGAGAACRVMLTV